MNIWQPNANGIMTKYFVSGSEIKFCNIIFSYQNKFSIDVMILCNDDKALGNGQKNVTKNIFNYKMITFDYKIFF